MKVSGNRHRAAAKERLSINGRAPQDLSRERWLPFCGVTVTPNGRMDTIGAYEDIGLVRDNASRLAVPKGGRNSVPLLRKSRQPHSAAEVSIFDALSYGTQQ